MTITPTPEWDEWWAEAAKNSPQNPSELFEFYCQVPKQLGKGYVRDIEVYPQVWLGIENYEFYDDVLYQDCDCDHPLQLAVCLSGTARDKWLIFAVASQITATQLPQQLQTPQAQEKPASETPSADGEEPIELVVTGEQDSYSVPNASTATRTDTRLRDIPQSIQVVPRQVLEDHNVTEVNQAIETVSGVLRGQQQGGGLPGSKIIRGFLQEDGIYRNGFRDGNGFAVAPIATIEQLEVLKRTRGLSATRSC